MARYILASRRAGKFTPAAKADARRAADTAFASLFAASADVVAVSPPADPLARRVVHFEADPADVAAKSLALPPDVLVEPAIPHYPLATLVPADFAALRPSLTAAPIPAGAGARFQVTVKGGGDGLEGAEVILFLRPAVGTNATQLTGRTNAQGKVAFDYNVTFWQPAAVVAAPAGDFWAVFQRGPESPLTLDAPALPKTGPVEWWHRAVGVESFAKTRGQGIKVGVIDTGCGPHPCLEHVRDAGSFIIGQHDPAGGADVDSHGTHVCGTIGGRPTKAGQYGGIAPGAALFIARVFPGPETGADQGDIALAIDALSRTHQVDLINMSLGASVASQIEQDAIRDALERGTLCVCAAGNDAPERTAVNYPAAFPECVAVAALGVEGWAPDGTVSSIRLPLEGDRFGADGLYLANFSCFGPELTCAAPGVGVISTVPERFGLTAPFAAMDGTSMASPAACGALAARLGGRSDYKQMPRDRTRADLARRVLIEGCRDINLAARYEGRGVPTV